MEFKRIYACKCGRYLGPYDIINNHKCETCGTGCNRISMYESIMPLVSKYDSDIRRTNRVNRNSMLNALCNVSGLCKSIDWKMQSVYDSRDVAIKDATDAFISAKEKWRQAVRAYNKKYNATVIAASPGKLIPKEIIDFYDALREANKVFTEITSKYYDIALETLESIDEYKELDSILTDVDNYCIAMDRDDAKYHRYLQYIREMSWMRYYDDFKYDLFMDAVAKITDDDDKYLKSVLNDYKGKESYIRDANALHKSYTVIDHAPFPYAGTVLAYSQPTPEQIEINKAAAAKQMEINRRMEEEQEKINREEIRRNIVNDITYMLKHSPLREIDPWVPIYQENMQKILLYQK